MNEALATSQLETDQPAPLVNAGAVVGGTAIGLGLAVIAGTPWTSEAFTGSHRIFYNHLAWWFGGSLIGAAFIGSLIAAVLSTARESVAGLVNGLATASALIAIGGAVALAVVQTTAERRRSSSTRRRSVSNSSGPTRPFGLPSSQSRPAESPA